jgi:hypothetical protein
MSEDNGHVRGTDLGGWTILAMLLLASLAVYFVYSPRVSPAIRPVASQEAP